MNPETTEEEVVLFVENPDGTRIPLRPAVEVEVVKTEEPADHWVSNGFLPEIARICNDLEGEHEKFLLSAGVRQIIETINNARSVEDFNQFTQSQLSEYRNQILHSLPEVERQVVGFVNQLTRARTVAVDSIDFI